MTQTTHTTDTHAIATSVATPIALVVGANGGIGRALCQQLSRTHTVIAVVRHESPTVMEGIDCAVAYADFLAGDTAALLNQLEAYPDFAKHLDTVIIATGILQDTQLGIRPEKRFKSLHAEQMKQVLEVNTILPMLALKTVLSKIARDSAVNCLVISARVGSISDNRMGGWHSYRASKAALNMYLKTLAIELTHTHPQCKILAYHPGTVDTELSKPFSKNTPAEKLFSPEQAAQYLLQVSAQASRYQSGDFVDWRGDVIQP